ncbi:MAG TPA: lytic transglycosylase domain-containing protein [Gammaproteobacteria bacterium]|nr:lytic transglycosylase domain-containing protein [Gammaproteobacteria bacterium]
MKLPLSRNPVFMRGLFILQLMWLPATSVVAAERQVDVPFVLNSLLLEQGLRQRLFTASDGTAPLWQDGTGCNYLILSKPQLRAKPPTLNFFSRGEARIGKAIGNGKCLILFQWQGYLSVNEQPYVMPPDTRVRFKVLDTRIYGLDRREHPVSSTLWQWVRQYIEPKLEQFTIEISQPLDALRKILPLVFPQYDFVDLESLLNSLQLANLEVVKQGVRGHLRFKVTTQSVPTLPAEPVLSKAELGRWREVWRQFDHLVTSLVRELALQSQEEEVDNALLNILLDARYAIEKALTTQNPGRRDPVRSLFLATWQQLAPLVRHIRVGQQGKQSIQLLSLVTAADALQAADRLGTPVGLEITVDGMRRLARILSASSREDSRQDTVDPQLRELFHFGPPLDKPPPIPDQSRLDFLLPSVQAASLSKEGRYRLLNRMLAERPSLDSYLALAHSMLVEIAAETEKKYPLGAQYKGLFRPLLLATAWQETCWRQYIKKRGKRVPFLSRAGAVGIMQVIPRVWRGFYDPRYLRRDVIYNARAGSEILMHYLRKYAITEDLKRQKKSSLANLVQATYAAYNGGPREFRRYRKSRITRNQAIVYRSFLGKFRQIKAGRELAVRQCYVGTGKT